MTNDTNIPPPTSGPAKSSAETSGAELHAQAETAGLPDPSQRMRPAHKEPEHIGPFRILEKVSEGGMGTVWMAEQREPVRGRVVDGLGEPNHRVGFGQSLPTPR